MENGGYDHGRNWSDYAIVAGAVLIAGAIIGTLIIVSGINARANQLVANDATRAKAGAVIVERLEGKLDAHIEVMDAHAAQPPPTVIVNVLPASSSNRGRATTSTATTTAPRPTPTTATPPASRPVLPLDEPPPCKLAVLNVCLLR